MYLLFISFVGVYTVSLCLCCIAIRFMREAEALVRRGILSGAPIFVNVIW